MVKTNLNKSHLKRKLEAKLTDIIRLNICLNENGNCWTRGSKVVCGPYHGVSFSPPDFWIYPGENVIGRLESCQICLPAASVSKTHAVIEVPSPDGPHLLYDQGSLNRTRRQRVVLIPQVRYSLQDGDTLLFGDEYVSSLHAGVRP
uniref:FHA domain-containing protein n=1 Tax=Varanus komodoensis TaxID=61221 RepID=A0A8D2J0K3_VARKO